MPWAKYYCNLDDPDYPYPYCPSLSSAVFFALLFCLSTFLHLVQAVRYHGKFCWVIVTGGTWATLGYTMRALSTLDISPNTLSIAGNFFIQTYPLWISAFVHTVFGKAVDFFVPEGKVSGLRGAWASWVFVLSDVLCFTLQAAGAVLVQSQNHQSGNSDLLSTGSKLSQAGLGIQLFFLLIFTSVVNSCNLRLRALDKSALQHSTNWKKVLWPIYGALLFLGIRVIYGLTALTNKAVAAKESAFYGLVALPMIVCIFIFNGSHLAGGVLKGKDYKYAKDKEGAGKQRESSDLETQFDRTLVVVEKHESLSPSDGAKGKKGKGKGRESRAMSLREGESSPLSSWENEPGPSTSKR
ncbi:hypothetical protein V5O48_013845 [Marasmius crinis-equi]|uniref:Uncharacterized protein n=1 Tax=Marasmius crinis-equi TaxID=585013 RepID=A0ABR3EYZ3_9AGAR